MKIEQLKKRFWRRIHFWYVWLVILLLVDEYIKEGYIIKPGDFLKPLTHENILLIATLTYIIMNILGYLRGVKRGNRDNS